MGNGDEAKETLRKLSELGAYIKILQKDVAKVDELQLLVNTLNSEVTHLQEEMKRLRGLSDKIPMNERSIQDNEKAIGRAFKSIRATKASLETFRENLKDYPEMLDAYKQVKATVIKIMILMVVLGVASGLGISALYNYFVS